MRFTKGKKMQKSEVISSLVAALAKAQGEFKPAVFDRKNPHFNSAYASLTAVVDAVRDSLSKHGLVVSQIVTSTPEGKYFLETILAHTSGEWIAGTVELLIGKRDMQGIGSAVTYAKRYCFSAILGIVSDADPDDDGNGASGKPPEPTKSAPRGPAPQVTPKAQPRPAQARQPGDFDFDQRPEIEQPQLPPPFQVTKMMVDALRAKMDGAQIGRNVAIDWLGTRRWDSLTETEWKEVNALVDGAIEDAGRCK